MVSTCQSDGYTPDGLDEWKVDDALRRNAEIPGRQALRESIAADHCSASFGNSNWPGRTLAKFTA